MKKVSGILWGIVLVAVGVILTLNAFGVANVDIFFDGWWTLFIIVPCVIGLFTDYDKSGHLIGICIGVFLLLCCQDVLNFDMFWKLLAPAIIVIIGVKMILGSIFDNRGEQVFKQIKENRYQGALSGYKDKILLVGISYDADGSDKKQHTCVIEELQKFGTHEKNFRC